MNFSKPQEDQGTQFQPKQVYLGKAGYKVVAVNPDNATLKSLGQFTNEDEPVYTFEREINNQKYRGVNITIYLQSPSDVNIIDRVTYSIVDNVQLSQTGKLAVINKYGDSNWIEESHLKAGTLPDTIANWYVNEGVKGMKRGEKELVSFIRALRNFKKINSQSSQEDKDKYISLFEESDLEKLFKGDFSDIRTIIMDDPNQKVGFLLGARSSEGGKVYQDMFKEYPLRSYMITNEGSNEFIIKEVKAAQENGRYANTYFDLNDLRYKKYNPDMQEVPVADNDEDQDDLPF